MEIAVKSLSACVCDLRVDTREGKCGNRFIRIVNIEATFICGHLAADAANTNFSKKIFKKIAPFCSPFDFSETSDQLTVVTLTEW